MSEDTPQQARALRSNKVAQKVRAKYPAGSLVVSKADQIGIVKRHVPALTALGGTLVISWLTGYEGRVTCLNVEPATAEDVLRAMRSTEWELNVHLPTAMKDETHARRLASLKASQAAQQAYYERLVTEYAAMVQEKSR